LISCSGKFVDGDYIEAERGFQWQPPCIEIVSHVKTPYSQFVIIHISSKAIAQKPHICRGSVMDEP
jgi:hypothetical protein